MIRPVKEFAPSRIIFRMCAALLSSFTFVFTAIADDAAALNDTSQVRYHFFTSWLDSDIDGYLQTPDGGMPERTDRHRPTFDELGIDKARRNILGLQIISGPHHYLVSADLMKFKKRRNLKDPLLSQWIQFDAGENVNSSVQMDAWHFRYSRSWSPEMLPDLSIRPGAEIMAMDFHYRLYNQDKQVDRSYIKGGYRLGAEVNYQLGSRLSLGAEFYQSLPLPNTVDTTSIRFFGHYDLLQQENRLTLLFGVSYRKLRYQDEQEVPNHLIAKTSPAFSFGIRYSTSP